jgi:hypothetical protein
MPLESGPDLPEALRRKVPETLDEALPGEGPDLLAKHLAITLQPALSRRYEDLEREEPARVGREWHDGDGRAGLIRQLILQYDGWTRLADF